MTRVYFEIQADDLERAMGFYRAVLGWRFRRDDQLPIEYWRIDARGADAATAAWEDGALLPRPAAPPPPQSGTNAFVCSFEVDDFDAAAGRVAAQGGQVALEKLAIPGVCWQGYFIDTEGNTFGVFQPDSDAR